MANITLGQLTENNQNNTNNSSPNMTLGQLTGNNQNNTNNSSNGNPTGVVDNPGGQNTGSNVNYNQYVNIGNNYDITERPELSELGGSIISDTRYICGFGSGDIVPPVSVVVGNTTNYHGVTYKNWIIGTEVSIGTSLNNYINENINDVTEITEMFLFGSHGIPAKTEHNGAEVKGVRWDLNMYE